MTDLERVRVHARYECDCPGCGDIHDEQDVEPASGSVATCHCGEMVEFE